MAPTTIKDPPKWDRRFLKLATEIATWSKDPSTQTGAVIVRPDKTIASVGYNGFPRGMNDGYQLYENREYKYAHIIHCEMNAVLSARERMDGYTLYTYPFASCDRCAVHMVQCGIKRYVAPPLPEHLKERWGAALEKTYKIFQEAGCQVDLIEI